jgi:hypothetical protein
VILGRILLSPTTVSLSGYSEQRNPFNHAC